MIESNTKSEHGCAAYVSVANPYIVGVRGWGARWTYDPCIYYQIGLSEACSSLGKF